MKRLVVLAIWLYAASLGAVTYQYYPQWTKATETWVALDNSKRPGVVFVNSYTPEGCHAGQWCSFDLTALGVTTDAKAAFLSGLLLITHGNTQQLCDLTVAFRAPGSAMTADYYSGQVIEPWVGGGQRTPFSTWVPLVGGKFEFQWNRNTTGQWPAECSYGVNLSVQAWVR